jgi:ATP-dependent DNA helicase DinG
VDVPGESLSYVFLEKLPYPSLGDPIEAARMTTVENAGGNPFYDYQSPKMVITLKQGFGRLIRSTDARGAAILLDKRLRNSLQNRASPGRRRAMASIPVTGALTAIHSQTTAC